MAAKKRKKVDVVEPTPLDDQTEPTPQQAVRKATNLLQVRLTAALRTLKDATAQDVASMVSKILAGWVTRGSPSTLISDRGLKVVQQDGAYTLSVNVTPDELMQMAYARAQEGANHEEVGVFLKEHLKDDFEQTCVELVNGEHRLWALRPRYVVFTMNIPP